MSDPDQTDQIEEYAIELPDDRQQPSKLSLPERLARPKSLDGFTKNLDSEESKSDADAASASPPSGPKDVLSPDRESAIGDDRPVSRQSEGTKEAIRNKLRAKYNSIQQKAEVEKRYKRRQSQLHHLHKYSSSQLEFKADEDKLKKAIEKAAIVQKRLQHQKEISKAKLPSTFEQYQFFAKVYHKPPEEKHPDDLALEKAIEGEAKGSLVETAGAFTAPNRQQVEAEKKILFIPSVMPQKDSEGAKISAAEDGFYVEKEPHVSAIATNTMEDRLLRQYGKENNPFLDLSNKIKRSHSGFATFSSRHEPVGASTQPLTQYVKASILKGKAILEDGIYKLDVDCGKILFTHHPLFCKENILILKLMDLYGTWLDCQEAHAGENFDFKLKALRDTFEQVKTLNEADLQNDRNARKILSQIQDVKQQRNNHWHKQRQLLEAMLKIWNSVKALRSSQAYTVTSYQLYLRRTYPPSQGEAEYNAEILHCLEEERLTHQIAYVEQVEAYAKQVEQYKSEKKIRLQAAMQQSTDSLPQDEEQDSDIADDDAMLQSISAPQRPEPFNEEAQLLVIRDALRKCRGEMGEPIYEPVLASNAEITPIDRCPPEEQQRRNAVSTYKYKLRIMFNDVEVCQSAVRPLNADFYVVFSNVYSLHVVEWPKSISVTILESTGSAQWTPLATSYLPIPGPADLATPGQSNLERLEFSSDVIVNPIGTAVGNGHPVTLNELSTGIVPMQSGLIQCSALWGRSSSGASLAPPAKLYSALERKARTTINSSVIRDLKNYVDLNKLDPNDPENIEIMKILKNYEDTEIEKVKKQFNCFRLEPPELELMSEQEFMSDRRFKLLELRNQHVAEFRNMKMIPARSKEIPADVFKNYNQRLMRDKEKTEMTDIEAYRTGINKYLAQVRERVIQKLNTAKQSKSLQDVVNEEPLPSIGKLSFLLFADPGRPLKPPRTERKKAGGQKSTALRAKIIANVVRAFNVPIRQSTSRDVEQEDDYFGVPTVEPFVEVAFQGQVMRTSTLTGSHPTWNQQLFLAFRAPNDDYSPESLQTISDSIYFNVYDRIMTDLPEDDRIKDDTVHQQIEKRWLGSLKIPFSSLYFNGRVYGSYRLQVPPVLLSYSIENDVLSEVTTPHLQIFMAIDPPLTTPDVIRGKLDSIESDTIVNYARAWTSDLCSRFPLRRYVPLVTDMNGRAVHVSRFLRAIQPPQDVLAAFAEDPFKGLQFLSMLCGDEEEHALLFSCWAAGLDLEPYLILGNAIPEGPRAAYVLVKATKGSEFMLYNASAGEAYSIKDPLCPLLSVGSVANPENVWGNIQENDHCSNMSFDFTNSKQWQPFFTKSFTNPSLTSVQPESIAYMETAADAVQQLQDRIERAIRDKFMSWRPYAITRFNRFAVQTLRQLITNLETDFLSGSDHQKQHRLALQSITSSYQLCGFPLNSSYHSTEQILEMVKATNLHQNHDKDVEFALAVHIHAYTNDILSVWVYIASLVRRRDTT